MKLMKAFRVLLDWFCRENDSLPFDKLWISEKSPSAEQRGFSDDVRAVIFLCV